MHNPSFDDMNEILTRLAYTPEKSGDLTSIIQHIANTAKEAFMADECTILTLNPMTEGFINSITIPDNSSAKRPILDGDITHNILQAGLLRIENLEDKQILIGLALRTQHRKRPLGVIYLSFSNGTQLSTQRLRHVQIFATQASHLLQETWLAHSYEEMTHIGQDINQNLSTIDDLFQQLQTYIDTVFDSSHALLLAIHRVQADKISLFWQEQDKFTQCNASLQGICQHVLVTRQAVFIKHLSQETEQLPCPLEHIEGSGVKESLIFVPILLLGETLGVLSIQHSLPDTYGQEDLQMLQLLATHTALVLHNMRLYNGLNQLNEVGQLLTRHLDSVQTLPKILQMTGADLVVLYPYDAQRKEFFLPPRIAGELIDESTPQIMSSTLPDGITTLILKNREPIFVRESSTIYDIVGGQVRPGNFQQREQIRSTATIPLLLGNEAVGVLYINFRQPQNFDTIQRLLIEGVAHFSANAVKNAHLSVNSSLRRVYELEMLQYIVNELNRNLSLHSVLSTLLTLAKEHVTADTAAIMLYNPSTRMLEVARVVGNQAEERVNVKIAREATKGITRWVLENKRAVRVDNVHRDEPWMHVYFPTALHTISELDVPLMVDNEVIGVLNFESNSEGTFRQEDQDFLTTLAGPAVLAIKKAQAYERATSLAKEAQALNKISKEIAGQLNLDQVLELVLDKALELTNSAQGALMLYDPNHDDLIIAAERGAYDAQKGTHLSMSRGIVGYVARHKKALNVDPTQPPWNDKFIQFGTETRSELAVPMLAGNDLRGILNVESPQTNNFNESTTQLFQGLADLAVVALQNAEAYEREKRFAAESRTLNEISKEITSQLNPTRIFELILEKAFALTNTNTGSLELYDVEKDELRVVAESGRIITEGRKINPYEGVIGHALKNRQVLNINIEESPWKEIYSSIIPGTRSEIVVPMLVGENLYGVINIESPNPGHFNQRDVDLLQGLADLAVVALQNAERYIKAEREAQRFKLLYRAGQELSEITEWSERERAYDVTFDIAQDYSQSHMAISIREEERQELVVTRTSQTTEQPLTPLSEIHDAANEQIAREIRTSMIHDMVTPASNMEGPQTTALPIHSSLITPIKFKDRYYGDLSLSHESTGYFNETDSDFLEALAQQLATTIYRLQAVQETKESEQRALYAEEEMAAIGQVAFELTHRLGNDLGLVRSFVDDINTELEKLRINNSFIHSKLDKIVQGTRKMLDLGKGLKKVMTRSGETAISKPVELHPGTLLDQVLQDFDETLLSHPNITINLEVDNQTTLYAAPDQTKDILRNIITNAIEALPDGGAIDLRTRESGPFMAIDIHDSGKGIPSQILSRIFDLSISTKGSSGFGLWSARRNAIRNKGDLKVESVQGQGATFILLLPKIERGVS